MRHPLRIRGILFTCAALLGASCVAGAAASIGNAKATAANSYAFHTMWGSEGSGDGQFGATFGPGGIVASRDGSSVFITDPGNYRIQVFTRGGGFVREIIRKDDHGNPAWSIVSPIAEDVQRNLYVVTVRSVTTAPAYSVLEYTVHKITADGTEIASFVVPMIDDWASVPGTKITTHVTGIAVDGHGFVYVADGGADRILRYDPNQGYALVGVWAKSDHLPGDGPREFNYPTGVACDENGHLYVLDSGNHRIQKLNAMTGEFISQFGTPAICPGGIMDGFAIACDPQGNVYEAEAGHIQKFTSSGAFVTRWGSVNTASDLGLLWSPEGLSAAFSGDIFVSDTGNRRIQVFAPSVDKVGPLTWAAGNITTHKGGSVAFKFKVSDINSMDAFVTIKIKKGTHVVKSLPTFWRLTGSDLNSWPWVCSIGKGSYRWYVYAKDSAGNAQRAPVGNKAFTVK